MRRGRGCLGRWSCGTAGDAPYSKITKKTIIAGRDRRKATPFAANDFLKAMRSLFKWAKDSDFITDEPTEGVEGFGHKTEASTFRRTMK